MTATTQKNRSKKAPAPPSREQVIAMVLELGGEPEKKRYEKLEALQHAHDRKRRNRAADVRDQEQLCGPAPGALHPDIVLIDADELGDLRRVVVNVRKQLEHELGRLQHVLLDLSQAIVAAAKSDDNAALDGQIKKFEQSMFRRSAKITKITYNMLSCMFLTPGAPYTSIE